MRWRRKASPRHMCSTQKTRARGNVVALRLALLAGSVAFVAYGIVNGEWLVVLAKGVRICLECIGIA